MRRIFIAADLPAEMREEMSKLKRSIKGVRWYDASKIHLTLRFIGEVENQVVEEVKSALYELKWPKMALRSDGLGLFFYKRNPRVIWIGLQPADELQSLREEVDQLLKPTAIEEDSRPFKPHVTLGKCKKFVDKKAVLEMKDELGDWKEAEGELSRLTLYSSTLSPDGAIHTPLEQYPFH